MVEGNSSASITTTYNNLMKRCNNALTYTATPYTGQDPTKFIEESYVPGSNSRDLALAYWFTGDKKYARKSIEIIEAWAESVLKTLVMWLMRAVRCILPEVCIQWFVLMIC